MTTYLTRSLTSYSYMISSIIQKLLSKSCTFYNNHCGGSIYGGYGSHCRASSPKFPRTNHCGRPIGGRSRGHC